MGVKTAIVLLTTTLLGCHVATAPTAEPKTSLSTIRGQVSCDGCRVHYFDGVKLGEAMVAKGQYTVPVVVRPLVVFISGPDQVPQTVVLRGNDSPSPIRLNKNEDPRQGYVVGVVVKTRSGGKQATINEVEPVANADVAITLGRARTVVQTDAEGRFQMALPANTYRVFVEGQHRDVTVPAGDTALLPIVIARMIID